MRQETGGYELALTITLVLQANRLTKGGHPKGGHPKGGQYKLRQTKTNKCLSKMLSADLEAAVQKYSVKNVFLENSPENTCARVSFLIKLQA